MFTLFRSAWTPRAAASVIAASSTVPRALTGIVVARLAINGGIRVVYPFLPAIARGLDVSLRVVVVLVASRSLAGLVGPVVVRVVSPHRQRALMLGSQLVVMSGCALVVASAWAPASSRILVVGLGFVATGLARPLFDLPMQAWVSARVPATARGRALGLTELAWALSLALTVPLAGVLIEHLGWRSPFVLVAGMAGIGVLALVALVPSDDADAAEPIVWEAATTRIAPVRARRIPAGVAVCIGATLAVAASESLFVVYGEWLSRDFGFSIPQIGVSALLVGAAEAIGTGLVVAVSDRIGLRRMLFGALMVSVVTYGILGLVDRRVALVVAVVGTPVVAFEITFGVLIALASTVSAHDDARARLLGALMAAVACGNAVGATVAPVLFAHGGIELVGAASTVAAALAVVALWFGSTSAGIASR